MTTDPRLESVQGTRHWGATDWARVFDRLDAAAGVVRVDTRDPATIERIERALHEHIYGPDFPMDEARCCADIVLAALAEATP